MIVKRHLQIYQVNLRGPPQGEFGRGHLLCEGPYPWSGKSS